MELRDDLVLKGPKGTQVPDVSQVQIYLRQVVRENLLISFRYDMHLENHAT